MSAEPNPSNVTPSKWYYVDGQRSVGPLEEAHLQVLVKSGQLKPQTLVFSAGLKGWTPYAEAFAPKTAPPIPPGAPPLPSALDGKLPRTPPAGAVRQKDLVGFAVAGGVVLSLAVLLTVHVMRGLNGSQASRAKSDSASQEGAGRGERSRRTALPGEVAGESRRAPEASPRDYDGPGERAAQSARGILGMGLEKDQIERMVLGKTRGEVRALLGSPSVSNPGGSPWRYTRGVNVYDRLADLTYQAVEFGFELTGRAEGAGMRFEYTVSTMVPLSTPEPRRGKVKP